MRLRHALFLSGCLRLIYAAKETFSESLTLEPLPDGKVAAHFSFVTTLYDSYPRVPRSLGEEDEAQHYTLFPLPLGQLLRAQAITELHLTLNSGKWDYDDWGHPPHHSVGSGAELWVWMADGAKVSVQQRWKDLANGLAGLFCASLGALDDTRTTRPLFAFQPAADLPATNATYQLLHAFLPSESVCTENLTPFLKLLPCKGRSGLATLLNPHPLFDSNWHGIGVHVVWREDTGIEVKLTFGAVLDPVRVSRGKRDWSFSSLFGRSVSRACPVVSNSSVAVQLPVGSPFQVEPEPTFTEKGASFFDLSSATFPLDVALRWPFEEQFQPAPVLPSSPLTVSRVLTGGSWSQGGVLFNFINRQNVTQEVVSVETAPWFINYFLNTRMVSIDGERRDDIIIDTSYTLPNGHRPSRLETTLRLPPHSETQITMLFSKSFIAYTEHPPDAERGWDLPPAVISFADPNDPEGPEQRIYTRNLLIDLPTPDFSMPYNVIIMSSTVIALFFGSVFNLLTRKFVWVKTGETDVIH